MTFTGCGIDFANDSYFKSPIMNDEQILIYEALYESVGENIKFKYMTYGNTPIKMENIDDETTDEALVFYQKASSSDGENITRVNVLDKIDGKWTSVYDFKGEGTGVEKALISSVGDGEKIIIIGYEGINAKQICIYKYQDNVMQTLFSLPYTYFDLIDFENTDTNTLFLVANNTQEQSAYAYTYICDDNMNFFQKSSVKLMNNITNYVNMRVGYHSQFEKAVYLDSKIEDGLIGTEIISAVNCELYNPINELYYLLTPLTIRKLGYNTIDFNNDMIEDIPTMTLFNGYSSSFEGEKQYITDWYNFKKYYKLEKIDSSFYNKNDAYVFTIPMRWRNLVTIKKDLITNEYVFYKYEKSLEESVDELLRIKVAQNSEMSELEANGYEKIGEKGILDYMVKYPKNSEEPLVLTKDEILNNFFIQ